MRETVAVAGRTSDGFLVAESRTERPLKRGLPVRGGMLALSLMKSVAPWLRLAETRFHGGVPLAEIEQGGRPF